MFVFILGFMVVEPATLSGAELNYIQGLFFSAMICLVMGLLALHAYISPNGDFKNTISVIRNKVSMNTK